MAKQQIILTVPDATDFNVLPAPLLKMLDNWKTDKPVSGWTMPGTRLFTGRRAIHIELEEEPDIIEFLVDLFAAGAQAGWEMVAAKNQRTPPIYDYSDPDNPVITGYSGIYKKVPLSFIDYVRDLEDANGDPYRPTAPCALHTFDGSDPWQWESE